MLANEVTQIAFDLEDAKHDLEVMTDQAHGEIGVYGEAWEGAGIDILRQQQIVDHHEDILAACQGLIDWADIRPLPKS